MLINRDIRKVEKKNCTLSLVIKGVNLIFKKKNSLHLNGE
jgi:hypothetical protein